MKHVPGLAATTFIHVPCHDCDCQLRLEADYIPIDMFFDNLREEGWQKIKHLSENRFLWHCPECAKAWQASIPPLLDSEGNPAVFNRVIF